MIFYIDYAVKNLLWLEQSEIFWVCIVERMLCYDVCCIQNHIVISTYNEDWSRWLNNLKYNNLYSSKWIGGLAKLACFEHLLNWQDVEHLGLPWWLRIHQPAMRETWVWSLGWEDPLQEGMATHSSILAWRIPMDREAWGAAVHGVTKSRTRLSTQHRGQHRPLWFMLNWWSKHLPWNPEKSCITQTRKKLGGNAILNL